MKLIYKARGLLMVPPALFSLLCTWNEVENEAIIWGMGGILFLLGLFLRVWSQMHLHYRLKIKMILITTGPYRYCRNPIYIGNTLLLLGFVAMAELLWFIPVMLIYCMIVYSLVVRYEEAYLIKRYGKPYEDYLNKVHRWMPAGMNPSIDANTQFSNAKQNFFPSVVAEMHILLMILPLVFKELVT